MYGGGREKKTKRETKRSKQAAAAAAAEAEADDGAAPSGNKRDKWLKKDSEVEHGSRRGAAWQPPQGEVDGSLGEQVFMRWDELLGAREGLKRRLDTIAAVHGWESRSARKCFLGGIEPGALVRSLRAEVCSLDAAAADLERADLLLQLQHVRRQLEELELERERSTEDMAQLQEANFEARALLSGQEEELDALRQLVEGEQRVHRRAPPVPPRPRDAHLDEAAERVAAEHDAAHRVPSGELLEPQRLLGRLPAAGGAREVVKLEERDVQGAIIEVGTPDVHVQLPANHRRRISRSRVLVRQVELRVQGLRRKTLRAQGLEPARATLALR